LEAAPRPVQSPMTATAPEAPAQQRSSAQPITLALPVQAPARPAATPAQSQPPPQAATELQVASIFIGRIDVELASAPTPAPAPPPVQRTRGFARYARSRRGLRG